MTDRPQPGVFDTVGPSEPEVGAHAPDGQGSLPALTPDEQRWRLLDAVARFVADRSGSAPVALVLDDLHWADAGTLTMLRHVAERVPGHRLLVVGAYRTDEAPRELVVTCGALRSRIDVTSVRLRGLDRASVAGLVGDVVEAPVAASLAAAIGEDTGGNPFLVREVARHLRESGLLRPGEDGALGTDTPRGVVPDGVREVLARRRARLSADANRFLDHASGFDGPFPFAVVAAASRLDEPAALGALDEVLAAGLVEPDTRPERYRFAHALVRHATYGDLNPSRRVRLHRTLARHADDASRAGADVPPEEVAAQYRASAALPGGEAGVEPALAAADRAAAAAAHDEAADFLAMACELARPGDDRLPGVLARRGMSLACAGRFDEAVDEALDAAEGLADARGPHPAATHLAQVAAALTGADSAPHAWRLAGRGLALAGDERDAVWASLVLHELDRRDAADPDFPGMMLDVPERREALRVLLDAGETAGRADLARYAVAARHGRRDRIPAEAASDPTVRLFLLGDAAGALPLFETGAREAAELGRLAQEGYCRGAAARCRIALGELDAGRAGLDEVAGIAGRIGGGWGWSRSTTSGRSTRWRTRPTPGGETVLAQLDDAFPGNASGRRLAASASACAARAAARLGRADDAGRLVARALPALSAGSGVGDEPSADAVRRR